MFVWAILRQINDISSNSKKCFALSAAWIMFGRFKNATKFVTRYFFTFSTKKNPRRQDYKQPTLKVTQIQPQINVVKIPPNDKWLSILLGTKWGHKPVDKTVKMGLDLMFLWVSCYYYNFYFTQYCLQGLKRKNFVLFIGDLHQIYLTNKRYFSTKRDRPTKYYPPCLFLPLSTITCNCTLIISLRSSRYLNHKYFRPHTVIAQTIHVKVIIFINTVLWEGTCIAVVVL